MKLISFVEAGRNAWGVVRDSDVVVLTHVWPDVIAGLEAGVDEIAGAARADGMPCRPLAGLQWLPPVPAPRKILCVGLNYGRHVAEAGRDLPAHPSLFARFADSVVGHREAVWKPRASDRFDYEGELAVVIGRGGRHIAAQDALAHVAGYTCMAENSVRDFQKHNAQVTPGKNFERSGAIGPWLVTADEVGDPARLQVISRLNGELMQQGDVSDLIFPIPELIAYISAFTPLSPGDIIATGTPEGVGSSRKPPRFMVAGDTLEVDIPGIGTLVNTVADEPARQQGDAHG
ncbi:MULTISPECIES: fumarylacetoacetate hydrolase family protein [Achromobacter]|uniref:5-carboxymethyl-2-hydroxymuconate isomerase n=1 Tax=Achromobacter spanius TaxID=217203 RepID=A0AAW3I9K4_9BURK|nr:MULTISPECIES: fumarylacetoacetate hydrolase family protein [Achromobacter]KNE29561.1 5-carboxymethyl-2-hydroxymuconate isomerase [Achromobacter spanius]MCD0499845.1 fumarylacetoacetate hydrolase family protein [Achromobacter sp. MY14]MCW3152918.1 fumarylacetoacetate hydrolase family protein [Achromobacter spanius]